MICRWCNNKLSHNQIYEFLRGKTKGNSCSKSCSMMIMNYKTKELYDKAKTFKCKNCSLLFKNTKEHKIFTCSKKCTNELSSKRMTSNNPMSSKDTRIKVSNTLKKINHKPKIQGGNGRVATIHQLSMYNELSKIDNSFVMELIEKTSPYTKDFNSPYHYKIDIASRFYKIAIEIDGSSHNSKKIKECDSRKEKLLSLKGWKVLRLSNFQIQKELTSCVKMVLSMM